VNIYQIKFLILNIIFFSFCKNKDINNICPDYKYRDSIYNSNSSIYLHFSTIYNYDTSYYFLSEINEGYLYFLKDLDNQRYKLVITPVFKSSIINPKLHFNNLFINSDLYKSSYRKSEKKIIYKKNYFFSYFAYTIDKEKPDLIINGLYYNAKFKFSVWIVWTINKSVSVGEMDCFMETLCSSFYLEKCN